MEQENENLNSTNEVNDQELNEENLEKELQETEDSEVLKEKNRQLFARAKKAEVELKELKNKPKPEVPTKPSVASEDLEKTLDEKLTERLEKRDLESMDYPDDIKTKISNVAKIEGISVKKAAQNPYIVSLIETFEESRKKEEKVEEATVSRKNKSGSKQSFSFDKPPEVDIRTPEGQKEWEKWKEECKTKGY